MENTFLMMGYAHSFSIPVSSIVSVLPSVMQERQTVWRLQHQKRKTSKTVPL